jgi:PAS domain-containing protein
MTKRKSQTASFGDQTSSTEKEAVESYYLKPERFDVLPALLGLIVLVSGLAAALTSFFLLRQNEFIAARTALNVTAHDSAGAYETALNSVELWVQTTTTFFSVSTTPLTLEEQLVPFVYSGGAFPKFVTAISYSEYVPFAQQDDWLQATREKGGYYTDLEITARSATNQPVPAPYSPNRAIVTQIVPTASMSTSVGYDQSTDALRNETINRAIANGRTAASARSTLNIEGASNVGVHIMAAVYNYTTSEPRGIVAGSILLGQLTFSTVAPITKNLIVSIIDMNVTSEDPYKGFIYSTATSNGSIISYQQNLDLIAAAPFTASRHVSFADKTLNLVLIPTDAYMEQFNSYIKIIALVVSLSFMLLLLVGCVFLYLARKLLVAKKARASANVQIDLLSANQSALRTLLDRIAMQEQKTRATINAIPDLVCVITYTGKIVQTNQAFDSEFPFTQQELERGVQTYSIFTELASDFYHDCDESEIETQAARRFGGSIPVLVRVRALDAESKEDSTHSGAQSHSGHNRDVTMTQMVDQESFVIIARNMSKSQATENVNMEQHRSNVLEQRYRNDTQFKEEVRALCEKEKCSECVQFLDSVRVYKKSNFSERLDLKQQIFDRYIKQGAPRQLNLSNEQVIEESIKITKAMADIEIFKPIETAVFRMMYDVYARNNLPKTPTTPVTPIV